MCAFKYQWLLTVTLLLNVHNIAGQQTTDLVDGGNVCDQNDFSVPISGCCHRLEALESTVRILISKVDEVAHKVQEQVTNTQNLTENVQALSENIELLRVNETVCPNGFIKNDHFSSCYMFINQNLNWNDSQNVCSGLSAHLVHVESVQENNYLLQEVNSTKVFTESKFWLGGNDLNQAQIWRWADGGAPFLFTNWNPGEPNHERERCLEMRRFQDGKWNDVPCTVQRPFICEIDI
nr:perlucin-like protein [Novocrania anomala]